MKKLEGGPNMKTKRIVALLMVMVMMFALAACSTTKSSGEKTTEKTKALKVALLITSNLGDKGFYDSANNGIKLIADEFPGSTTKVIEMGQDPSVYEANIRDIAEGDWDYIIIGTSPAQEVIQALAPEYSDKKFILFDFDVDRTKGDFKNVYSISYKQNEGTFIAGMVAAMATSGMSKSNDEKVIGFIGGMDLPIINDFLIGYIEGAQYIEPDIKVTVAYAGTFVDSAKGKELALAQINQQKIDVVFAAASTTGIGALEAAYESGIYAIGVDGDQEAAFRETNPGLADTIITSMLKRVDISLLRAVKLAEEGSLPWGTCESVGIAEDSVGVVMDGMIKKTLSDKQLATIEEAIEKVKKGEITISSAMEMDADEFAKIAASVAP
jgi:basic membrane protein A